MALQLTKTLSNGLVANYWKISRVRYDLNTNTFIVGMELYADKASKTTGLDIVWVGDFYFTNLNTAAIDTIYKTSTDFVAGTYAYLKTKTEFLGSTDI